MDTELEFQQLVRKSGIVFTTNLGQGVEEWVLAIATPTLSKTQVATQADLVAAGFIRTEALRRLEAERDRLTALLTAADEHLQAMQADKQAREGELRALEERCRKGEVWKKAEHDGVIARNRGEAVEANPYAEDDEVGREGHQAWRHGWRLRDVLLDLNERVKQAAGGQESLGSDLATLRTAHETLRAEHARVAAAEATSRQEAGQLRAAHDAAAARAAKLEEALRTIFAEAPHSPACALWTAAAAEGKASVVACDCWRSRLSGIV